MVWYIVHKAVVERQDVPNVMGVIDIDGGKIKVYTQSEVS